MLQAVVGLGFFDHVSNWENLRQSSEGYCRSLRTGKAEGPPQSLRSWVRSAWKGTSKICSWTWRVRAGNIFRKILKNLVRIFKITQLELADSVGHEYLFIIFVYFFLLYLLPLLLVFELNFYLYY